MLRLSETDRAPVSFSVDGRQITALLGDTLLTAMLCAGDRLRTSEFGGEARAGFCLMGACQDCWVWTETGERLRACTTTVANDMRILTHPPES